ncbi:MAG TPA: PH domain-containing protein [Candidatus Krumholzibacteria bacterium]|nr:PH domain-containing protein [Candidatus Krumholzibacteria bacterium]
MTTNSGPSAKVMDLIRALTNEEQDPAIVQTVLEGVQQIMTSGENVLYVAVQKGPLAKISPDCAVLTNRRFIVYRPKLLGRVTFEDHGWRDLHDAKLQENILGATFTLTTVSGQALTIEHLPKAQARRLYAFAQEMEEQVREERRARDLEEKRAAAGGVFVASPHAGTPGSPAEASDPVQRLRTLKEMFQAGLISASEYETKRAEIISKM